MENIETAILLLVVGMATVFVYSADCDLFR